MFGHPIVEVLSILMAARVIFAFDLEHFFDFAKIFLLYSFTRFYMLFKLCKAALKTSS